MCGHEGISDRNNDCTSPSAAQHSQEQWRHQNISAEGSLASSNYSFSECNLVSKKLMVSTSMFALSLTWVFLCAVLVYRKTAQLRVSAFAFLSSLTFSYALGCIFQLYFIPSNRRHMSLRGPSMPVLSFVTLRVLPRFTIGLTLGTLLPLWCLTVSNNEHDAISLLAGTLAYDLWQGWYGFITVPPFDGSEPSTQYFSGKIRRALQMSYVVDSSSLLIWSVTVLSLRSSEYSDKTGTMLALSKEESFYLLLWLVTKILRIIVDLIHILWSIIIAIPMKNSNESSAKLRQAKLITNEFDRKGKNDVMNDNLWTIHGKTYDLRSFIDDHPGGREALELGRGRDCTALYESYHPFTNRHRIEEQGEN
mmetsp:Transcript_12488/g.27577  ORF Transcript_12488/g.27577 Transcript_12488/m.27577 type:complete len:364 (-) Transcript_12488:1084-2175(-)